MVKIHTKLPRGLANVSPEIRKEISSKGGKAASAKKTSYRWNSDKGRLAVQKRWVLERRKRKGVSRRESMKIASQKHSV